MDCAIFSWEANTAYIALAAETGRNHRPLAMDSVEVLPAAPSVLQVLGEVPKPGIPMSVTEALELEEFEEAKVSLIANDRPETVWKAIRARRPETSA